MEIFRANQQWKTRPVDERFPTVEALFQQTKAYADQAKEKQSSWKDLRVEDREGDLQLVGKSNVPARLTNWAFGQICNRVSAPASYLRNLPATLVAQNINHGLKKHGAESDTNAILLFHQNGDFVLRAATSERYSRIWNYEIAERLLDLTPQGWVPATPDRVWSPEQQGVTALYASDHDMFAFLRMSNQTVEGSGDPNRPIYKGIIVSNSEVGASSLSVMRFLYNSMCGNHIIWGASKVTELSLRHVGTIREKFGLYATLLREYADESVSDLEAKIKKSKKTLIAQDKEAVLDAIFGKRSIGLSRKTLAAGFDACIEEKDGSPLTSWGLVAGLTRFSQTVPYADDRTMIDRGAARVLEVF